VVIRFDVSRLNELELFMIVNCSVGLLMGALSPSVNRQGGRHEYQRWSSKRYQRDPVSVFWKDKDLVYLGCNAVFARDAGLWPLQRTFIGKDDYQMGVDDQAELYRGDDRLVIESGSSNFTSKNQTTPDANTITLLTSKGLCVILGGVIGVLGTYMDITQRSRRKKKSCGSRILKKPGSVNEPHDVKFQEWTQGKEPAAGQNQCL